MMDEPAAEEANAPASGKGGNGVHGNIDAELCAAREAAERRHAEREAMLRSELQHRVRNTLALVRSIFARSVAAGGTIEDLADHFPARIDVLARYQLSWTHEPHGTVDLETMVHDELQSFHPGVDPRIAIEGPVVRLRHKAAQAMGLALHELATNSIKFGTLGLDGRGKLHILWVRDGERVVLRWEEAGVAVLGQAPLRAGFGREFIEQALPYQLGAETSFDLRPGGLCCTIALPPGAWEEDPGVK